MTSRRYSVIERQLVQEAVAHFYGGAPDEAAARFSFIATTHQDDYVVHFNLAVCWAEAGNSANARVAYDQALKLRPDLEAQPQFGSRNLIVH
jgi:Flp pilus assembly protein TadD